MDLLTFINQDQAEIVTSGVFFVDLPESWGQVEPSQEQTNGYRLAS